MVYLFLLIPSGDFRPEMTTDQYSYSHKIADNFSAQYTTQYMITTSKKERRGTIKIRLDEL